MKNIQIVYAIIMASMFALVLGSVSGSWAVAAVSFTAAISVSYAYRKEQGLALMACGVVSANQTASCDTRPVAGQEVTVYVFNREEIASYTYASGNNYIIESMSMVATKLGFAYKGLLNSNNFKSDMVELKYYKAYQTTGDILLFSNTGTTLKELDEGLVNGDLVVIVENKDKGTGGNAAFDVHGIDVGLSARKVSRDPSSNDSGGAWVISLGPPKDQYESKPYRKFFDTDYATTKAAILALITP